MTRLDRHAIGVAAVMVCALMLAEPALAANGIEQVLNQIITMLSGPVAKAVAVIAVIAAGYGYMFGHFEMRTTGMILIGIGVVFGAPALVQTIAGV
jgi:type IV secretion system protein VirB2